MTHPAVKKKTKELLFKAADRGEYQGISHDETFKILFCLIGQDKMSQKSREFHAVHTFRGFSGCTIGISLQRSTSNTCFINAVNATFEQELASKVKFMFSDKTKNPEFVKVYVTPDPTQLEKTFFSSRNGFL